MDNSYMEHEMETGFVGIRVQGLGHVEFSS